MINFKKRHFLLHLLGLPMLSLANPTRSVTTPPQALGPFYPSKLPLDRDADLTMVAGKDEQAAGEIVNLYGSVVDPDNAPITEASVEIWQCDAFRTYHHPLDGGGTDPFFQGYGRTVTNDKGHYRFKTIKPVAYPGRAPHIHVRISTDSKELITQIYVKGDPLNQKDFLLNSIADEKARQSLQIGFNKDAGGKTDELFAVFNPILS
jgi:protocatechuate 3,4-dioxygenase beta subunit